MDEIDEKIVEIQVTTVMAIVIATPDLLNSLVFLLIIDQVILNNL